MILLGERPAGCLRVCAERERFGVLRVELLDDLCPEHAGGAHLGNSKAKATFVESLFVLASTISFQRLLSMGAKFLG